MKTIFSIYSLSNTRSTLSYPIHFIIAASTQTTLTLPILKLIHYYNNLSIFKINKYSFIYFYIIIKENLLKKNKFLKSSFFLKKKKEELDEMTASITYKSYDKAHLTDLATEYEMIVEVY